MPWRHGVTACFAEAKRPPQYSADHDGQQSRIASHQDQANLSAAASASSILGLLHASAPPTDPCQEPASASLIWTRHCAPRSSVAGNQDALQAAKNLPEHCFSAQVDQGVSLARELVQNDSQLKPTASPWSALDSTQRPASGSLADFPLPRRSHDLASELAAQMRAASPQPSGEWKRSWT